MSQFFNQEVSQAYDEKNRKLAPIAENMHFLIRLLLSRLPDQARILCVGVGTGAEIFSLAQEFPRWTFLGLDPSGEMLEVCRQKLLRADFMSRCELVQGFVSDLPEGEEFDAALSVLVGHFVKREARVDFYRNIASRIRRGGIMVDTELSFDLESREFPSMLKSWERVQSLMGATPESLASLPTQLRDMLTVLPPSEVESLLRQSGIPLPVRFFQSFLISGWYGVTQ